MSDQEFVMSREFVIVDILSRIQSLLLQNFYIDSQVPQKHEHQVFGEEELNERE